MITTERLILRAWTADDREPVARLNADSQVMEHFPAVLTREDSDAAVDRIEAHFRRHGYGLWAVTIPGVAPFAGFIGLMVPGFDAHFMPSVEIGWRLAPECWGRGYATEGARAVLDYGFDRLALREIVSMTVPANRRSRRVMEKLWMRHDDADDFEHPLVPAGHRLRHHVLYRLGRQNWLADID